MTDQNIIMKTHDISMFDHDKIKIVHDITMFG